MIRVGVTGAIGKMGKEVVKAIYEASDTELVCAVDIIEEGKDIGELVLNKTVNVKIQKDIKKAIEQSKPDIMIDFTSPAIIFENAKTYLNNGVIPVIGTTGLQDEQIDELKKLSKEKNLACFIAPNFTTGAVLMMMFSKMAAKYFNNAEIIEFHHNQKKDAPSGTAIRTAKMMAESNENFTTGNCPETEIIEGSRGGTSYGNIHIHSVRMPGYIASQEVILGGSGQLLKIRHDTMNRESFMPGVLLAIRYVYKNGGFVYGLDNIL